MIYFFLSLISRRLLTTKYVENDVEARDVSVVQRNCRFPEENYVEVHKYYSFSACSVQCRKDEQVRLCGCNSHVMPNTNVRLIDFTSVMKGLIHLADWQVKSHCNINGLVCLNEHYEDLSIVIAAWSKARKRKGIVCDCMPRYFNFINKNVNYCYWNSFSFQLSCNEVDILMIHETRDNIYSGAVDPFSIIEVTLASLPTERYKRNVVRGKLDLVGEFKWKLFLIVTIEITNRFSTVSIGGSTGLFVGASLLSFVEIIYYFTIRAGIFNCVNVFNKKKQLTNIFSKMHS